MSAPDRPRIIDRSAEVAHSWFHEVAAEMGDEDLHAAGRALRSVLHVLRDQLTVEETAQLAAQLPTLVRGLYYEGWQPSRVRRYRARDVDSFLQYVAADAAMAGDTEASHAVAAVATVLARHVSPGEMEDVLAILPARIRPLFRV